MEKIIPKVPDQLINPHRIKILKYIGIFGLFILIPISFWMGMKYQQTKSSIVAPTATVEPTPTPTPTKSYSTEQKMQESTNTPIPFIPPTPNPNTPNSTDYFRINISTKDNKHLPTELFLKDRLAKTLNLTKEDNYRGPLNIYYDTREGDPYGKASNVISEYNFNYYIYSDNEHLSDSKVYEDEFITVKVSEVDQALEPYLEDPNYCESDSDCMIRTNYCDYGSFNPYHGYFDIWGCGEKTDESGYIFGGATKDLELGCIAKVTYQASSCIDNQCTGQDREVFCLGQ